MKRRNPFLRTGRRDFIKKAAFLGAAAFFAGTGGSRAATAKTQTAPLPETRSRYRMTAHIRKYYERAAL